MSKEGEKKPRIREVKDPERLGTIVFPVPPGMVKQLREREARRKAEREAQEKGGADPRGDATPGDG